MIIGKKIDILVVMSTLTMQQPYGSDSSEGSTTQKTYKALRRMIIQGELKPGEKLKIDGLCKRLNTGASPVREALSLLSSGHLVQRNDQRGFRAAPVSRDNFEEILKLRCTLEDMALRDSIANRDEQWEESVVLSHHRMTRKPSAEMEHFEDYHKSFHMTLLGNCGAPILFEFCSQLYDLNIRYRLLAGHSLNYHNRNVTDEHLGIMEAAIAGDAELASARLLTHYRSTGNYLMELFESDELLVVS